MFTITEVNTRIKTIRVPFHGVSIDVPSDTNIICLTVDREVGAVHGWKDEPTVDETFGNWSSIQPGYFLGFVTYIGAWEESLYFVSEYMKLQLSK